MTQSLRVNLRPLASPFGADGQIIADGATISFEQLGPAGSSLKTDVLVAATLKLRARFIEHLRSGGEEVGELATLDGQLVRSKAFPNSLTFTPAKDADGGAIGLQASEVISDDDDGAEDDGDGDAADTVPGEVRVLRFVFDAAQFEGLASGSQLLLRIDAARFHHLEVSVQIELGGTVEAPFETNDTLDVLITRRNPGRRRIIALRLTDELGATLPGANVRIVSGATPAEQGADPSALVADGDAIIRLKTDPAAALCEVSWGPAGASDLSFSRKIFLDLGDDPDVADPRRLSNLGYDSNDELRDQVLSFQADFARLPTGRLRDIAADLRAFHDDGVRPELGDATEPGNDAVTVNDGPLSDDRSSLDDPFFSDGNSAVA